MERRLHAVVRGCVQGVGYRAFAVREAQRLGVRGWVRNRPDGSVELVAEGPEEVLRRLLGRLEQGPSEAEVSRVEAEWEPSEGGFTGFGVRY